MQPFVLIVPTRFKGRVLSGVQRIGNGYPDCRRNQPRTSLFRPRRSTIDFTSATNLVSNGELLSFRRGLHDRVCASSAQQLPRRGVLILEREWRGPDGKESNGLRTLQGRGREGIACGGVSPRLHFPTWLHLPVEPRKEPNFTYRLLRRIYPAFRVLSPTK